jgi:hypothetical protein
MVAFDHPQAAAQAGVIQALEFGAEAAFEPAVQKSTSGEGRNHALIIGSIPLL